MPKSIQAFVVYKLKLVSRANLLDVFLPMSKPARRGQLPTPIWFRMHKTAKDDSHVRPPNYKLSIPLIERYSRSLVFFINIFKSERDNTVIC